MLTVRAVVRLAAEVFGQSEKAILGDRRVAEVVRARQAAMAVAHAQQRWTAAHIGRAMNKDHTTVLHALRAAEDHRRHDSDYDEAVRTLEARVTALAQPDDLAETSGSLYVGDVADDLATAIRHLARRNPVWFADLVRPLLAAALKGDDGRLRRLAQLQSEPPAAVKPDEDPDRRREPEPRDRRCLRCGRPIYAAHPGLCGSCRAYAADNASLEGVQ